ncbi:hypothetical protein BC941DRAFT_514509 [Chlamydoabsidia padenii]|nr:hypothetical protein BC941DRAFT_514509 [Chlamydoabsidia padenii]
MIPPFFFPNGRPISPIEQEQRQRKILAIVKHLYGYRPYMTESCFIAVTKSCGLPRYMNFALFRKISPQEHRITYAQFVQSWLLISKDRFDDESLFFSVLKKHQLDYLTPDDFLPVLQEIVMNHPGLQFLSDNSVFQEKYIETVICRLFYDADCSSGRMTLKQFRKSQFTDRVKTLGSYNELNNSFGYFSYKHFYVIYCKFWALDHDHDLKISASNLMEYNDRSLSPRIVQRIIQCGRMMNLGRETPTDSLSFLDFVWFLLAEVDKTSSKAIEYWFRCMDEDGDGILSSYELEQYWHEQLAQQLNYNNEVLGKDTSCNNEEDDLVRFDDILRQMNDLIQPQQPGQFRLTDLKRNGYLAERFFDTFLHFNKFQLHESHQGCLRLKLQLELDKIRSVVDQRALLHGPEGLEDIHFGYLMFSDWADYAEAEYQQILMTDHQETKLDDMGPEEGDDDQLDVIDDYTHDQGSNTSTPLVLSTQPFFETAADDPTALLDDPPTSETYQIDTDESHQNGPGDYLDEQDKSACSYYYSYYSPTTAYLGKKVNINSLVDRAEQTSDLEEEEESDSTPSTPTFTISKDSSPVLMDLSSDNNNNDNKSTATLVDPISL